MEHVVFFTGSGGAQFRRTQSLEEAVRVVEHLRNVEGVEDAKVYALSEVALAFKTVYRVEVQAGEGAPAPLAPLPPLPAMPDMSMQAQPAAPAPAPQVEAPAPQVEAAQVEAPVAVAAAPAPQVEAPAPPAEAPAQAAEAPEPAMAAVPSEPYEAAPEPPSNGKPRGMGFFSR
ncbi:MAG TPA: hypothetical protein VNA20_14490 [Frankiaceae bacterium]|nr:hypothetical protein [Frankiaceae bacterium]